MKQIQTNPADKMRLERMIADGERLISPQERRKAEERKKRWNNLQQEWKLSPSMVSRSMTVGYIITQNSGAGGQYSFQGGVASALVGAGMPSDLATWFSSAIGEVWRRWALSWKIPFLPLYPAFVAFPLAQAPPMPSTPFPLGAGVERLNPYEGERTLLPDYLSNTLYASSCEQAYPGETSRNACNDFANWFSRSYFFLMGSSTVSNVLGWGPVPSFAPPYVPVGPVVGGTLRGMPGCVAGSFIG